MLTKVYNMAGKQVGEIELPEAVFGVEPNAAVVHDAVKNHLANKRQGTQSALTRAEVSGGGRKPWRQKAPAALVRAAPVLLSGLMAVSCSLPSPAITAIA